MKKGYIEFLKKETPAAGGCMLCQAVDGEGQMMYLLVERHKGGTGDIFTVNGRFYFDYDFLWDDAHPWEVIYKRNI